VRLADRPAGFGRGPPTEGTGWRNVGVVPWVPGPPTSVPTMRHLSDPVFSGTLYVDMDLEEGSSPLGLFLVCRELKMKASGTHLLTAQELFRASSGTPSGAPARGPGTSG